MSPIAGVRNASALLVRRRGDAVDALGTCFAYRNVRHFLTAAHCIAAESPDELRIRPLDGGEFRVTEVFVHPEADAALLVAPEVPDRILDPFWDAAGQYTWGESIAAFGFPVDVLDDDSTDPVPRLFRGSMQRYFRYSRTPYRFFAGELSMAAPSGLSGGPVWFTKYDSDVAGIVMGNLESTTFRDSFEEVVKGPETTKTTYAKLVTYGVCVMVDRVNLWLLERIR
jgi:hypothetical protein